MMLIERLERIKDFRRKEGLRYPLGRLLVIVIMSIMSGYSRYREIAMFAKQNEAELLKGLNIPREKLPSHVTFREILKRVDFNEVLGAFHDWAREYVEIMEGEWLAVDGKAIGSTLSDYDKPYQEFVSLVSVFTQRRKQVLAVAKLENKKMSEIKSVQTLLESLDLQGVIFTLDALHCQKNTGNNCQTRQSLCRTSEKKSTQFMESFTRNHERLNASFAR